MTVSREDSAKSWHRLAKESRIFLLDPLNKHTDCVYRDFTDFPGKRHWYSQIVITKNHERWKKTCNKNSSLDIPATFEFHQSWCTVRGRCNLTVARARNRSCVSLRPTNERRPWSLKSLPKSPSSLYTLTSLFETPTNEIPVQEQTLFVPVAICWRASVVNRRARIASGTAEKARPRFISNELLRDSADRLISYLSLIGLYSSCRVTLYVQRINGLFTLVTRTRIRTCVGFENVVLRLARVFPHFRSYPSSRLCCVTTVRHRVRRKHAYNEISDFHGSFQNGELSIFLRVLYASVRKYRGRSQERRLFSNDCKIIAIFGGYCMLRLHKSGRGS